ncbi:hypothetical protein YASMINEVIRUS_442 [Yasminevirus sp. GU-2018]|uniref:Uncharacterized protein n=1 Tax=Yasminevirus sp. GU-2018 TaxID=2420051 RepID=A0A5K0U7K0_9VIRU|nr:hypothetical protein YASMINEVIRUS_442 [Yasminevirus sp. GU-2018]
MNRSRQRQFLTGANGGYSTDIVTGQSELQNTNGFNGSTDSAYVGTYNTSYQGGIDGSVHLGPIDYTNPRNTIHNNIGDRVLAEQVFDNRLFIDSEFRDYSKHPDPFKFVIKFGGVDPQTESVQVEVDGNDYSYTKYLSGDTTVVMDRTFKNIKAVVVNTLILPYAIEFKTKENGAYEKSGRKLEKMFYKYIILKINELCNGRSFSNNKAFGQESFIMKIDDETCSNHHRWIPVSNHVSYPDSRLRVIDRLTVEICNDKGERLCPKLDGKPHDFFGEYRKLIDKILLLQKKGGKTSEEEIVKLTPKLESLKHIVSCLSPELHVTFCSLDPQIQTLPQY